MIVYTLVSSKQVYGSYASSSCGSGLIWDRELAGLRIAQESLHMTKMMAAICMGIVLTLVLSMWAAIGSESCQAFS